jgi:small subunit ribosomal protein S1
MNARQPDHNRKYQNAWQELDEGWWASVLAEESQHGPARPASVPSKTKPSPSSSQKKPEGLPTTAPDSPMNWDEARHLYTEDAILEVKVTGHNHGGLLVEKEALAGFVPFSHLVAVAGRDGEVDRDVCLEEYNGKTLRVKMIECVPEDARLVFSERAALTPPGKRTELFHLLKTGDQVPGKITNVTDFGVFVDLGGVEGLIHLSELSWGRVTDPGKIVRVGEEIKVQVLDISAERCRVALSLKRLVPNPWLRAESEFPVGRVLPARVTSVLSYGAFARIEVGVEGLIHASEMPLTENQTPRHLLSEGQSIQVRVLHLDPAHQRLGLSMKTDFA